MPGGSSAGKDRTHFWGASGQQIIIRKLTSVYKTLSTEWVFLSILSSYCLERPSLEITIFLKEKAICLQVKIEPLSEFREKPIKAQVCNALPLLKCSFCLRVSAMTFSQGNREPRPLLSIGLNSGTCGVWR